MAYFHCLIGGGSSGGGYELTVTCDADFAGTTITATDGVTTLTQTCPSASPYEVVFEIPNGGDWTISGVVSGQTITTGVSIPTTAELIAIIHQTLTIHSATEDTITYTDIYGDTQTEVFASGESSKQITVDIEPSGSSITFTSSVAKDPTNLSNAYSKTITIDSNTTDAYIMPDKAIYWWGNQINSENANPTNGWANIGSYAFNAPVYGTNSVDLTSVNAGANTTWSAVGVKNGIANVTKACGIGYRYGEVTAGGRSIDILESKTVSSNYLSTAIDGTTMYKFEVANTYGSGTVYPRVICSFARCLKIYAIWAE